MLVEESLRLRTSLKQENFLIDRRFVLVIKLQVSEKAYSGAMTFSAQVTYPASSVFLDFMLEPRLLRSKAERVACCEGTCEELEV